MYEMFVHLRAYTSYSLSEGAIKVDDLLELCIKNKLPAIAITDSANLFCSLEFSQKAITKGIKPILGVTINIDSKLDGDSGIKRKLDKIVLLAKNKIGYLNLIQLVSNSYILSDEMGDNHISIEDLKSHSEGLIVLTAGFDGTLGRLIKENRLKDAENFLCQLKSFLHDNLYVELIRRGITDEDKKESYLLELAYKYNIPLVATNEIFFHDPSMHEAHDVLLCISDGRYLEENDRRISNKESYFKSAQEMQELFSDIPEAIQNTIQIAKRCSHILSEHPPMLPKIHANEKELLIEQSMNGLRERLELVDKEEHQVYYDRLDYELSIITEMNFSGYFLIVSDFIRWSKSHKIPVGPGRGSGAGSVVAWSLQITDLDPIKFGLIFERFLNPERISMPDFDIDFCQERRDEVIEYVCNKYGNDRVAQIITFGKLQARAVIRDVGRVLQMPYSQVDRISKMVPFNPVNPVNLSQAIEMEPMLQKERDENDQIKRLLTIALKLEGLNKHVSTHAAGIVIAERPLIEMVPLYKDQKSDMLVIQYSMKYAEMAGLVKFDFLGLKTLTLIANTCDRIKLFNHEFSIDNINLDDPKTYEMLSKGDSTGIFQFESAGMRDTLRKLKPDSINDLMALGALYRPGPMDNIPVYIACKHGRQKPDYLHPCLEEVLKETFGVIIYQEQVLKVAQNLAGYSLGAADLLRRAMGKKIKEEMDAQRELFVQGALKNQIEESQAVKIFDLVAKFAGYGFNRAHAASYALISYQTAYLKANYTIEFITSCLNIEIDDTDKINTYIADARSHNINVIPPDINTSHAVFTILDGQIVYGLGAIKNVGIQAMKELILERENNGPFKDIFDFLRRIDSKLVNKRQFESLVKAGVFDSLHGNRKQLFDSMETMLNYNHFHKRQLNTNQISLFGAEQNQDIIPVLEQTEDWGSSLKIKNEFESYGFYLNNHPLDRYKNILDDSKIKNSIYLKEEIREGFSTFKLSGVPLHVKTRMSAKGRFVSVVVSDYHGSFEISIFDDELLSKNIDLLNSDTALLFTVDAKKDEGGVRLTVTDITPLDQYLTAHFKAMKMWVNSIEALDVVKEILAQINHGHVKIYISLITDNKDEVEIELSQTYSIEPAITRKIQNIDGVVKLEII